MPVNRPRNFENAVGSIRYNARYAGCSDGRDTAGVPACRPLYSRDKNHRHGGACGDARGTVSRPPRQRLLRYGAPSGWSAVPPVPRQTDRPPQLLPRGVGVAPGVLPLSGVGFFREVFIMVKRFGKRAILLLG